MDINIRKFARVPFTVDAVEVTAENIDDVADWCDGELRKNAGGFSFIKVDVKYPMTTRQTRAYPGDWILFANNGFKVYAQKAFEKNYVAVDEEQ